ncbi:MAG: hypothetical protein R2731_11170 [Nocardioides sp.]
MIVDDRTRPGADPRRQVCLQVRPRLRLRLRLRVCLHLRDGGRSGHGGHGAIILISA